MLRRRPSSVLFNTLAGTDRSPWNILLKTYGLQSWGESITAVASAKTATRVASLAVDVFRGHTELHTRKPCEGKHQCFLNLKGCHH